MKTMKLFAAVALMCASINVNAVNNKVQLQHRLEHDVEGRVTTRTAYAWDGNDWQPVLRWNYTYNTTGYTIEFARYDRSQHRFSEPISKSVYAYTAVNSIAYVSTYTRSDSTHSYELTSTMLTASPGIETYDLIAANQ